MSSVAQNRQVCLSRFNLNHAIPILILGDGPDQKTGLGRIGHDLAWVLSSMPEFKVGYLGRMAFGRAKYPWTQYSFGLNEQWGEHRLQEAWEDLSQGVNGIVFTVWDASRLLWLSNPSGMPNEAFLRSGAFEKWGYFMQDSAGVRPDILPLEAAEVMRGFDRVLLASKWAYVLTVKSLDGERDIDWIPHGINREIFKPMDRLYARSGWGVGERDIVIGCVMANQQRKHWPTVFEAVARIPEARLWVHTDRWVNYWNLNALAIEYGVADRVIAEDRQLSDTELAMRYSACDATVMISGGEGFCYPVAESLSCGTPVVTGSYGAQFELASQGVPPIFTQLDTMHNVRRAYYDPVMVSRALKQAVQTRDPESAQAQVEHLSWLKLTAVWKKWFRRGIERD